ncbi:DbpA RNA binding domain-containing protein, partial [Patescibacteria group bacterium]|nr:DbpA RNA binding domain-containing protein [Patescibacteria group bacterium]
EAIHGEISQEQRTAAMDRFRSKQTQLLVATDVAARGIDVNNLSHVINYNLPDGTEAYVHRSGRTGRANNSGISLVIVNMREKYKIRHLEGKIGKRFEQGQIPSGEDICERQLFSLIDKVCNVEVNEKQISKYMELINKKFENMDRDELIKKFVSEEFNRFLEHYQNADDLNSNVNSSTGPREESPYLFARFKINIGKNIDLTVKELFGFLNEQPELRGVEIGDIRIKDNFTLLEVDEKFKDKILDCFTNADIDGIPITITCEETGIRSNRAPKPRGHSQRPPYRNSRPPNRSTGKRRGSKKRY